jgi:YLP motif-containing protein 1
LRGPPGSGKSHLAKLIREKEVSLGGSSPRILCLDDYFMTEVDEITKCPDTGRRIVQKKTVYEYEEEMEKSYMQCLVKSFKKTVTDGLHNFIIVDCVNQTLDFYNEFYNFGSANGFKVSFIVANKIIGALFPDTATLKGIHLRIAT